MSLRPHITAFFAVFVMALVAIAPARVRAETVGVLLTNGNHNHEKIHAALISQLEEKGYSHKVKFLVQMPFADPIALSNAARKLLVADLDAIITYGAPASFALLRERPKVPMLYSAVYEPLTHKIKSKWATGVCSKYSISSLLRYLGGSKEIKYLGVLYSSLEEDSKYQMDEIKELADKHGYSLSPLDVKRSGMLPGAMTELRADALLVTSSSIIEASLHSVIKVASNKKIPTASLLLSEEAYPMITMVSDPEDQGRLLARRLIKVLDGVKPKDIKRGCGRKFELIYNVKEAERLGLKVSMDLVTEATKLVNK